MVEETLTIRLYEKGDETGITKLFKEIFGREMTLEEWKWKYAVRGNGKVYSAVAVTGSGEIVAHYGGMRHPMTYHGKDVYGLAIGDVMVHPSFRGTKLFKKIAAMVPDEAVKDGIILGYGFPNERAMLLPEKLGLYEKVEDVFEAGKKACLRSTAARFVYSLLPLDVDDPGIDSLWASVRKELGLAVVRDSGYLRWRYLEHPLYRYELWGLRKRWKRRLSGFVVLRRENERTLLIDFLCRREALEALLQKTENCVFTSGPGNITLWGPQYLTPLLSSLGYTVARAGTCIPRTTHEKTLSRNEIEGDFFYTMGDTDFL